MEYPRVLFVPTSNAGVSYWRMWNFAKAMYDNRIAESWLLWYDSKRVDLAEWEMTLTQARAMDDFIGQNRVTMAINNAVKQADAIIFGLVHSFAGLDIFTSLVEMRKDGHLRNAPVLMEIDDNILSVPTQNPAFHSYEPGTELREIAIKQMRAADGLIVSTPFLADVYSEYNKNIFVAPNSIDWGIWGRCKNDPKPGVRIGWAGGRAHNEDLEILKDVIPSVLEQYPNVTFCFVNGAAPFIFELREKYGHRVEIMPWADVNHYPQMIASLDWNIALAPLVDSSFNRAKSNLRWLETGSLGIPCVASNVGHFAETVESGVDGVLCDSQADFMSGISKLIEDKAFRKKMGKKAKHKIVSKFSVSANARLYMDWLTKRSNEIADEAVNRAVEDLREKENEQKSASEPGGTPCGGPAADQICQLL